MILPEENRCIRKIKREFPRASVYKPVFTVRRDIDEIRV